MRNSRHRAAQVATNSCSATKGGVIRKRTETTIEVEEVIYAVCDSNRLTRAWCPVCGIAVAMVTPQHASAIAGVSVRTINRWVESESVHFMETPTGLLLLCANSLIPNGPEQNQEGLISYRSTEDTRIKE